jgi:hypothetical protein
LKDSENWRTVDNKKNKELTEKLKDKCKALEIKLKKSKDKCKALEIILKKSKEELKDKCEAFKSDKDK